MEKQIKIGGSDHLGRVFCTYHVVGLKHKSIYWQPRQKFNCHTCNMTLIKEGVFEGLYSPPAKVDGLLIKS